MSDTSSQSNEKSTSYAAHFGWIAFVASLVAFVAAIMSLVLVSSFAPRRAEGGRLIVDLSWSTYALIGNLIPIVLSILFLSIWFRSSKERVLAWLVAAAFCYLAHSIFLTDLLRRDHIGKF